MRIHKSVLAIAATTGILLCTSCIDLTVSLQPWFEVDDAEQLVFDARLLGWWCDGEEPCDGDLMEWAPGPGDSYNVFEEGRLAYRIWLAEIDGTRYLDVRFLCEPSLGTAEDGCHESVGRHFVLRVARVEDRRVELQFLARKRLGELLATLEEPPTRAELDDEWVLVAETAGLRELLERFGADRELWDEPLVLTRP